MAAEWQYAEGTVTDADIAEMERVWGVKLPEDYLATIRQHNAASPEPNEVRIPGFRNEVDFQCLLDGRVAEKNSALQSYYQTQDALPPRVFPFASDSAGDTFVFDYRHTDGTNPLIGFWCCGADGPPDAQIFPICGTFTELIAMLYEE